jgi:hypothetical protein
VRIGPNGYTVDWSRTARLAEVFSTSGLEEVESRAVRRGTPISLFNEQELSRAFSLILEENRAAQLAHEWFQLFGDEASVDEDGRYLYRDWRDDLSLPWHVRNPTEPIFRPSGSLEATTAGMYDWLIAMPQAQIEEALLSFSDIHLDLIALSSRHLRRQVELIRRDRPQINTDRRCKDLESAANKIRAGFRSDAR